MTNTHHAFDYLDAPDKHPPAGVCVVFGDEPFLKRLVLKQLRGRVLGENEADVPFATFEGRAVQWRDVVDELSTVALFGEGQRLVIVEEADEFVSRSRAQLEDYLAGPAARGVLVLEVNIWQSNTRLYKAVDKAGLQIVCRAPEKLQGKRKVLDQPRLLRWLAERARSAHQITLASGAADELLELVGPELGLLDQELAKLALLADGDGRIKPELVRDVVGGWRAKTTWEIIDEAVGGNAAEALRQLDHLLLSGENPLALFGSIAWSLRRFAAATRLYEQAEQRRRPITLAQALEQAGFRKWPPQAMATAEKQLKQLGRRRAGRLYRWLLDADLALKRTHSQPHRARLVLEKLFVRMARGADVGRQLQQR